LFTFVFHEAVCKRTINKLGKTETECICEGSLCNDGALPGDQGVQGVQGVQGGEKFQCYDGTGVLGSSTVTKKECKTGVTQCETEFKGNIFFIFLKPENIIKIIIRTTMFFTIRSR
jgi:hypothetical protein